MQKDASALKVRTLEGEFDRNASHHINACSSRLAAISFFFEHHLVSSKDIGPADCCCATRLMLLLLYQYDWYSESYLAISRRIVTQRCARMESIVRRRSCN